MVSDDNIDHIGSEVEMTEAAVSVTRRELQDCGADVI